MKSMRGFTLIEVLVALLVLGIGLLGVAGLQSATLGMNHASYLRSQATVLAQDITDRMRANPRGTGNGAYFQGTATETSSCTTTTGCTTLEMAQHDLWEWQNLLAARLPSGEGVVCLDSTPDDGSGSGAPACDGAGTNPKVKIWWFSKDDEATQRFVTEVRTL